jgi:hypothetical protein
MWTGTEGSSRGLIIPEFLGKQLEIRVLTGLDLFRFREGQALLEGNI